MTPELNRLINEINEKKKELIRLLNKGALHFEKGCNI